MKPLALLLLLFAFFFSCQQKENNKEPVNTANPILKEKKTVKNMDDSKQTGDTIFMNFKNEKGIYTAEGSLDSIRTKIFLKFKNINTDELRAKITTATGVGNIRFNQIIFPDNTSDGPFGMEMQIPLKQKGNHVIIIGHSQMAGDPYFGNFTIQLENK